MSEMQPTDKKLVAGRKCLNRTSPTPEQLKVQSQQWEAWLSTISDTLIRPKLDYFLSSCPNDSRPHLDVSIYGYKFHGLLDSGASSTVIGRAGWDVLQHLNLTIRNKNSLSCRVANGSQCPCVGTIRVPIKLGNKVQFIEAMIVLDLPHGLILGVDFWRQMKLLPDLSTGSWTFIDSLAHEPPNVLLNETNLTSDEKTILTKLVAKHFNTMGNKLGCTTLVQHEITTQATPIKQRYYPVNPKVQIHLDNELDQMLTAGIVEPSNSPWSSPVLLVRKPNGTFRFVVDYRKLNAVTKRDAYPLPYVNSILDKLRNSRYLSSIDLKSAYWQIPVAPDSKEKTAFTVPGRGLYQFNRMPFGLHNSPATWQRLMDNMFGPSFEPYVFVYLDDIIITTPTFEKHIEILNAVFNQIIDAGMTVNKEKCSFCRSELRYLGYVVDKSGLHVDPDKVKAILDIPPPTNVSEVRRFVGVASWYRRFIPNFSTIIAPLTSLFRKAKSWKWNENCQTSFEMIKERLTCAPILTCPDYDLPFYVHTDASAYGIGAVLTQMAGAEEQIICYISRSLSRQERNYSTTERECLAVIFAIEKLRSYLDGVTFTVVTDHASLLWLNNIKDPTGRLARWSVRLQGFNFKIQHRKGKEHLLPDLLSRAVPLQIDFVTVTGDSTDPWYRQLKEQISQQPHRFPRWKIETNKIYKQVFCRLTQTSEWRLVVPKEQRRQVLIQCHDQPTAGHFGCFKTINRVSSLYYWPKMRADITMYVNKCRTCQIQKPIQRKVCGLMGKRPSVTQPWQLISTDLMEFPRSTKGHAYLLVVSDYFSKYVTLFPLRQAIASKIAHLIEKHIFLVYGVPQFLICDNGKQFISKEFKQVMNEYQVKILYNANYHPQNNPTERVNRVVKTLIRTYLRDNHRLWDQFLPELACAINTSVHEVINHTPYSVNFGREHILSGAQYNPDAEPHNEIPPIDRTTKRINFDQLYLKIHDALRKAYNVNKRYYDLRRRPLELGEGQLVLRKNYVLSKAADYFAAKLAPKFTGPFIVKKKLSSTTYQLKDENDRDHGTWHIKDLKPYTET